MKRTVPAPSNGTAVEPSCLPTLTLTTTPQVIDALKDPATGLFGRNAEAVAEGLVRERLRELTLAGWARRR